MVGFGQTICVPIGPMCHECLNNDICPSRGLARKSPKKTPKKSPVKDEKNEALGLSDIKKELDLDKSPRKRKVTPKQKQQVVKQEDEQAFQDLKDSINEASATKSNFAKKAQIQDKINRDKEMNTFEDKNIHLLIKVEKKKAKSIQKRNIDTKEQNIEDGDLGKENVTVKAKNKDSPKKRKVTPRKQVGVDESQGTSSMKSNHNKVNAELKVKIKIVKNKT